MHASAARRRWIARLALGIMVVTAVWTVVLLFHGGFDTRVAGVRIRTNDPFRPLLLTCAAVVAFVIAVGEDDTDAQMARIVDACQRHVSRLDLRFMAIVLAAATLIVGVHSGSKAAGGSDSYG